MQGFISLIFNMKSRKHDRPQGGLQISLNSLLYSEEKRDEECRGEAWGYRNYCYLSLAYYPLSSL